MKNILIILLLLSGVVSNAQNNRFPEAELSQLRTNRISIGFSLMEMFIGRYKFFAGYGLNERNSLELSGGVIQSQLNSYPLQSYWYDNKREPEKMSGYFVDLGHKLYLHQLEEFESFVFLRSSLLYNQARLHSSEEGWIANDQDGITYHRRGTINYRDIIEHIGGRMEAGWETTEGALFYDFQLGVAYEKMLTSPHYEKKAEPDIFSLEYEGFSPSLNFRIGFYLN